jgi:hypothetical protein
MIVRWFRVVLLVLGAATVTAIGISRLAPPPLRDQASTRWRERAQHLEVGSTRDASDGSSCEFLDSETGQMQRMNLPPGNSLFFATSSPWRDTSGQFEVAGLSVEWEHDRLEALPQRFGLARYRFPAGEKLDQLPLDVVPSGTPCWSPDGDARILYAGTDGRLYQVEFEDDGERSGASDEAVRRSRPIAWRCAAPGDGRIVMKDPIWPADRRLKGRVFVSLSYLTRTRGVMGYTPARIWWLALDDSGTAIEAAGPLPLWRRPSLENEDERLPSLAATDDGELVLAYLARRRGRRDYRLRLQTVAVNAETRTLTPTTTGRTTISTPLAAIAPLFSADGQWVSVIQNSPNAARTVVRISIRRALSSAMLAAR